MPIAKNTIFADKAIVRLSLKGKVRYGYWANGRIRLYEGSPFQGGGPGKVRVSLKNANLLAPCRPSKVICVGQNYAAHAKELKNPIPKEPLLFMKPSTAVIGPGDDIIRPKGAVRVDYEAELAVVIGKKCFQVAEGHAQDYILGYTCLNDVTERHLQKKDGQYTRAKGFDTFCPLGPAIALDLDPRRLYVKSFVNAKARQKGHTSDMIFSVPYLVSFVSRVMTLNPGDVISTGTPAGVGEMGPGEQICVEVQGIGKLINPVKDAR